MSESAAAAPATGTGPAFWAARTLLVLLGLVTVGGAIYFTFFASEADGGASGAIDYLLGVWALANGLGFLVVAGLLDRHPRAPAAARLLLVSYLIFSAIKIAGYDETEVLGMVGVAVVVLVLLRAYGRG